ncbi:MAG: hypothetical protein DSM106950_25960 [Stigonema ocellatum SAG 48.90 = DSM 106950]|nr:hypothetical protein [Stigonema ocellatum SAG 48.90 = DSM 106950]
MTNGLSMILNRVLPKNNRRTRFFTNVEAALSKEAAFDGAMTIARISGSGIPMAHSLMNHLPGTLEFPLYKHQAQHLVRELTRVRVIAHLILAPEL